MSQVFIGFILSLLISEEVLFSDVLPGPEGGVPVCAAIENNNCIPHTMTFPNIDAMKKDPRARYLFDGICPKNVTFPDCQKWFDGCNICSKEGACTHKFCALPSEPAKCLDPISTAEQ